MLKKIGVIPDVHAPHEDKRAFNLMLKVFQDQKLDIGVVMGDFIDAAPVSSHSKDPTRIYRFEQEVEYGRKRLKQLVDTSPKARWHFIEGNHENRLWRYIMDKAPELAGLNELTTEYQLDLKNLGYSFTPYREHLRIGHFYFTHECGTAGANAIRDARAAFEGNVVIGHTHRMGTFYSGNAKGKARVGMNVGWLGDYKQLNYGHRIRALRDWSLGFGFGHMEPNGNIHLQPIPIIEYKCVVNGVLYRG